MSDTRDTCATRTTRVRHERHECSTNDMRATRADIFGFHNDTHENILSHPYISYIANEILQKEEQFHSKNYLSEMPQFHAKSRLKYAPQKLNFVMAKSISKRYTNAFARSRIVIRSNKTSFLITPLYVKLTTFFLASTNKN